MNLVRGNTLLLALLGTWTVVTGPHSRLAAQVVTTGPTVRVAGIVLKWDRGDRETNYGRLERLVREAAASGAKIVCTAECCVDGYAAGTPDITLEDQRALAEDIPRGAYYRRLSVLAAETKVHLIAGLLERDGQTLHDTAVFLGPDGKPIGKARKQKLRREEARLTAGDDTPVFDTPYGRIGLLIDADRTDPVIVRRYYDRGAQILFCPSGVWGSIDDILKVQARSRENDLFIVSVHPSAFLATGPEGATRRREILGTTPLMKRAEADKEQNGVVYFDLPLRPHDAVTEIGKATFRPLVGQALYHRSGIYGDLQPLAVCTSNVSSVPKPLLVQLTSLAFPKAAAQDCETLCRFAQERGLECVVLSVDGRGGGSLHMGYGEIDVYEAIEAIRKKLAIDPERISVTGSSVGGAATWYHASHYPDFWAAAAPSFGYCDHKISESGSLASFPRLPWEEFAWVARNAAYRVPNLRHVALRIAHGEWDRAVPGGVPVEHSRQMDRKLTQLGIPHIYTELAKTGHAQPAELRNETALWLLKQKRVATPDHVSLVVHTLRHNRSHWVTVEQQVISGKESTVEARRAERTITVKTTNVRRLAIGPMKEAVALDLDGQSFPKMDLTAAQPFTRSPDGSWAKAEDASAAGEKKHGLSGPFGDLFIAPTLVVYGLSGSEAARHFNEQAAFGLVRHFSQWNGGVHRGSIPGNNNVLLPVVSDQRLLELLAGPDQAGPVDLDCRLPGDYAKVSVDRKLLHRANLLLIGNVDSNAVLAKLASRLPVGFGQGKITLGGRTFAGDHLACFAIFPHPDGQRYVGLLSGNEPDAICWGSRVGLQLVPDYLVFEHERVVDWGFWNNHWRHAD